MSIKDILGKTCLKRENKSKKSDKIENNFHLLSFDELLKNFNTSLTNGLTCEYASELLAKNGKNIIKEQKQSVFRKIFSYLFSGFCGILWIASIICILAWKPIGNPPDPTNLGLGILLIIVILLQAAFTAFQDWSSSKVMKSIKNMMPSNATVIRSGHEMKIPVEEVVIGDLVYLSYGNKVPADVRIIESHDLKFDKSMLTGESEAIEGTVECTNDIYVESKNIAFMTTLITNGQGKGIVVSVGAQTMMGKIAKLTQQTGQKQTSLQKEITRFVIFIAILAITTVIVLLIVWLAWLRVQYPDYINLPTMMVNCIAVLVGFIPTGLPVAVTLSLLLMARRMAKHRVLVKNLTTIETLSCVNVIASDKTGTLTQNKMFVANVFAGDEKFELNGIKHQTKSSAFKQLASVGYLCNDASFIDTEENRNEQINQRKANGDATDIALLRFATQNVDEENFRENYTVLSEIPFNSKNKWMMKTFLVNNLEVHKKAFDENIVDRENFMLLKGAPDKLLKKCNQFVESDGNIAKLDDLKKLDLIKIQNEFCVLGQRVLLLCKRTVNNEEINNLCIKSVPDLEAHINELEDFCLIGMVGIIDPPREGISSVISTLKQAGIRLFMVTGDYALTAAAIAYEIGIFTNTGFDTMDTMREKHKLNTLFPSQTGNLKLGERPTSLLLNGTDIENLREEEWSLVTNYHEIVFSRTTPEQKLQIVQQFQKYDYVVGVTGDGVNDAPALKSADIGIAMGSGSEVAKEASQMVLMDNSFQSVLVAIENGRLVFDNLRKVILYLLPAGSMAEIIPIIVNIYLGVPLPLSAFLMICICVLTDMCPALSLMLEKPEKNLLNRPPRSKKDHLVDWKLILQAYLFIGFMEAIFSHCLFFWYLQWYGNFSPKEVLFVFDRWQHGYKGHSIEELDNFVYTGQTITFISLVLMQSFGNIFATRTNYYSFFQRLPFMKISRNLWIYVAQIVTIILMILIVFLPFCNNLFNTRPVPVQFFFLPLLFALIILFADELRKFMVRKKVFCCQKIAW